MNRTAVIAAIILASVAPAARAQQAPMPTPQRPVHPTPIPTTSCRGCTDATTNGATTVIGYDDNAADTSRRTAPRSAAPVRHKVKPAVGATRHSRAKAKATSKAGVAKSKTAAAKSKARAAAKPTPQYKDRPAVLDPMILPRASVTIKPKPDTAKK